MSSAHEYDGTMEIARSRDSANALSVQPSRRAPPTKCSRAATKCHTFISKASATLHYRGVMEQWTCQDVVFHASLNARDLSSTCSICKNVMAYN